MFKQGVASGLGHKIWLFERRTKRAALPDSAIRDEADRTEDTERAYPDALLIEQCSLFSSRVRQEILLFCFNSILSTSNPLYYKQSFPKFYRIAYTATHSNPSRWTAPRKKSNRTNTRPSTGGR